MQFDEIYVEYNNFFLEAGTTLMNETVYLKKVVEVAVDIPDDVLSDIESTLGQAKLLMDSKLPQFGQLLYFYLSKENNPSPVLPCDLQGWWDVASTQVEKVKARFNDLRILGKNGWKKPEPTFPVVSQRVKVPLKSMKNSTSTSECTSVANNKKTKTTKTQASSGLRQFLASKRKNAKSPTGAQNVMDLHPEFSPFDNTIDIEQSLFEQHLRRTNDESLSNILDQKINNHCPLETIPQDSSLENGNGLILSEDESFGSGTSTTAIFDEPTFSLPCKICDIYQKMKSRRKLTKYSGINISVECTNCGRFNEITQRRVSLRLHARSRLSTDEHLQNENKNQQKYHL